MGRTVLDATNEQHVASASHLDTPLSGLGHRLHVFSGIARPEFRTEEDDHLSTEEILVRLGVTIEEILDSSVHVGLASVASGDSGFVLALDSARLDRDATSGELVLAVSAAVRGEPAVLSRFGYQVVVVGAPEDASLSGQVRWHSSLFPMMLDDVQSSAAAIQVVVNRVALVETPPFAATEQLTPIGSAQLEGARRDGDDIVIGYRAPSMPSNVPLRVVVTTLPGFQQTHGQLRVTALTHPEPVVLPGGSTSVAGIDLRVESYVVA